MRKVKILFCIDWFYPSYKAGGPIKSVANLASFVSHDSDVLILTSNKDIDGKVVAPDSIKPKYFDGLQVIYLDNKNQSLRAIKKIIVNYNPDFVHLNSLFSKNFTVKPLIVSLLTKRKIILAPRGMLTEEALKIKQLKKSIFILILKIVLKRYDILFHASTKHEVRQIQNNLGRRTSVKVAQNISSIPSKRILREQRSNLIKLVFIARVSPIKNLLFFLKVLEGSDSSNFRLDLFGPIEDKAYWEKCKLIVEKDERICYNGVLAPNKVKETLLKYDYYVLPSRNENFGHSIVESISCGVPVLISDRTPWLNLEEEGVGFSLSLNDQDLWNEKLKEIESDKDDQSKYERMVHKCYLYAVKYLLNNNVKDQSRNLFKLYES